VGGCEFAAGDPAGAIDDRDSIWKHRACPLENAAQRIARERSRSLIALASDSPRLDPFDRASAFDPHSGVEHYAAGRRAAGRIEIGFDNLWNTSKQEG